MTAYWVCWRGFDALALGIIGGFVITEDPRFDQGSSYPLNGPNEPPVPFIRENLEAICNDITTNQDFFGVPLPFAVNLNGTDLTIDPAPEPINSGVFTAKVNRHAQVPGGPSLAAPDLWADSVGLGHPGRLATVYCGFKTEVQLSPGTNTIIVDYTAIFGVSTVLTYNITVKD